MASLRLFWKFNTRISTVFAILVRCRLKIKANERIDFFNLVAKLIYTFRDKSKMEDEKALIIYNPKEANVLGIQIGRLSPLYRYILEIDGIQWPNVQSFALSRIVCSSLQDDLARHQSGFPIFKEEMKEQKEEKKGEISESKEKANEALIDLEMIRRSLEISANEEEESIAKINDFLESVKETDSLEIEIDAETKQGVIDFLYPVRRQARRRKIDQKNLDFAKKTILVKLLKKDLEGHDLDEIVKNLNEENREEYEKMVKDLDDSLVKKKRDGVPKDEEGREISLESLTTSDIIDALNEKKAKAYNKISEIDLELEQLIPILSFTEHEEIDYMKSWQGLTKNEKKVYYRDIQTTVGRLYHICVIKGMTEAFSDIYRVYLGRSRASRDVLLSTEGKELLFADPFRDSPGHLGQVLAVTQEERKGDNVIGKVLMNLRSIISVEIRRVGELERKKHRESMITQIYNVRDILRNEIRRSDITNFELLPTEQILWIFSRKFEITTSDGETIVVEGIPDLRNIPLSSVSSNDKRKIVDALLKKGGLYRLDTEFADPKSEKDKIFDALVVKITKFTPQSTVMDPEAILMLYDRDQEFKEDVDYELLNPGHLANILRKRHLQELYDYRISEEGLFLVRRLLGFLIRKKYEDIRNQDAEDLVLRFMSGLSANVLNKFREKVFRIVITNDDKDSLENLVANLPFEEEDIEEELQAYLDGEWTKFEDLYYRDNSSRVRPKTKDLDEALSFERKGYRERETENIEVPMIQPVTRPVRGESIDIQITEELAVEEEDKDVKQVQVVVRTAPRNAKKYQWVPESLSPMIRVKFIWRGLPFPSLFHAGLFEWLTKNFSILVRSDMTRIAMSDVRIYIELMTEDCREKLLPFVDADIDQRTIDNSELNSDQKEALKVAINEQESITKVQLLNIIYNENCFPWSLESFDRLRNELETGKVLEGIERAHREKFADPELLNILRTTGNTRIIFADKGDRLLGIGNNNGLNLIGESLSRIRNKGGPLIKPDDTVTVTWFMSSLTEFTELLRASKMNTTDQIDLGFALQFALSTVCRSVFPDIQTTMSLSEKVKNLSEQNKKFAGVLWDFLKVLKGYVDEDAERIEEEIFEIEREGDDVLISERNSERHEVARIFSYLCKCLKKELGLKNLDVDSMEALFLNSRNLVKLFAELAKSQ